MTKVMIIAEHDGSALNPSTAKCVACATELEGAEIDVAVLGAGIADVAAEAASISGVSPWVIIATIGVSPRTKAIGTPMSRKKTKEMIRTKTTIEPVTLPD